MEANILRSGTPAFLHFSIHLILVIFGAEEFLQSLGDLVRIQLLAPAHISEKHHNAENHNLWLSKKSFSVGKRMPYFYTFLKLSEFQFCVDKGRVNVRNSVTRIRRCYSRKYTYLSLDKLGTNQDFILSPHSKIHVSQSCEVKYLQ
jgi:hypothetical protein